MAGTACLTPGAAPFALSLCMAKLWKHIKDVLSHSGILASAIGQDYCAVLRNNLLANPVAVDMCGQVVYEGTCTTQCSMIPVWCHETCDSWRQAWPCSCSCGRCRPPLTWPHPCLLCALQNSYVPSSLRSCRTWTPMATLCWWVQRVLLLVGAAVRSPPSG